jgi:hypothetical protein
MIPYFGAGLTRLKVDFSDRGEGRLDIDQWVNGWNFVLGLQSENYLFEIQYVDAVSDENLDEPLTSELDFSSFSAWIGIRF